eukprot:3098592-Alexandrium_andersonii.AAC.1
MSGVIALVSAAFAARSRSMPLCIALMTGTTSVRSALTSPRISTGIGGCRDTSSMTACMSAEVFARASHLMAPPAH